MNKTRVYLTESLSGKVKSEKRETSKIATIIMILGYIIIFGGFLISAYLTFTGTISNFLILISACLGSLILGILIIGFGKVISLLQKINNEIVK